MTDSKKVIIYEIIITVIILATKIFVQGIFDAVFFDNVEVNNAICNNIFNLNSALVVALLLSLISNKVFIEGKRHFRKIARSTTYLIILNSIIMSISCAFGENEIIFMSVAFGGNIYKFYDIAKHMLDIF
ncbi:hypothetical protein IJ798_03080 [Candidatus Saccharibacteria bacterium]|nr:hypothetical protein [Candidatus Saccharibacteria bacterium]